MCGKIIDDVAFSTDVTFVKGPGGQSSVEGQFVSEAGASRQGARLVHGKIYSGPVSERPGSNFTAKQLHSLGDRPRSID